MAIEVLRSGVTSSKWTGEGWDLSLRAFAKAFTIRFRIASKGGETTDVMVSADSDSFEEIAHAMMQADANAAIKAFGAALQAGLPPMRS